MLQIIARYFMGLLAFDLCPKCRQFVEAQESYYRHEWVFVCECGEKWKGQCDDRSVVEVVHREGQAADGGRARDAAREMKANQGDLMAYGIQIVNGFLFGAGIVLAAAFMRVALHLSVCG